MMRRLYFSGAVVSMFYAALLLFSGDVNKGLAFFVVALLCIGAFGLEDVK